MKPLKAIRILLAVLIFIPIVSYFCDFANRLPNSLHFLMHIQLVPAVLVANLSIGILIGLLVLSLLLGRVYCSVICPMGILQDILAWFTRRGKKKNRKKRWYHYSKPYNGIRYTLLAICLIFLLFGNIIPLLYLDPYSNFGRIAVHIFRPVIVEGNNLLNGIASQLNYYGFYNVTLHTITTTSFCIALTALLLVGILALLRGRLFCNTLCPVGSLLGLLSRFSFFRIHIDESKCNQCGLCEKACKAECIHSKEGTIDASRCVACFNCLDRCTKQAIAYRPVTKRSHPTVHQDEGLSRRKFLATTTAIAATLPLIPAWAKANPPADATKLTPITPPGSRSLKHFKEKCTACHLCVTHCPMQILKPAGFNFGWGYAFKPHLVYYEMAFCNYECTVCSEICPNGAIERIDVPEKKITQIGIAQFERSRCVVITDGTSCGACSEHCPVQAVRMEPYRDGLTLPHVYDELCIGCGGCESICPVRPVKAINILANAVHRTAQLPPEEKVKPVDTEELDFGF